MSQKLKKSTPIGPEAFRQIVEIEDPREALDECQALIKEAKKGERARIRASLGVMAELRQRFTKNKKAWRKLRQKKFWDACEGERPTMEDRLDGTRFVVRYAEKATTRPAAQKASKHAIVIKYLLDRGVKPADIPVELAKPGHGINAICQKASKKGSSIDASKGNGRTKPSDAGDTRVTPKAQPENDGWDDDDDVPGKGGPNVAR